MEGTGHAVATWRKSSYSADNNGNCVEVAAWRKSSHSSGDGQCVEVAEVGAVLVRDTKDRSSAVLAFAPDAWRRFAATVKDAGRE